MRQVAFYYPNSVPGLAWIKQSLLTADGLTSITHPHLGTATSGDLRWLQDQGLWTPTFANRGVGGPGVGGVSGGTTAYLHEVVDALDRFATDPGLRFEHRDFPVVRDLQRLYTGKLVRGLEIALLERALAKPGRFGGSLVVHRDVARVVLSITAKRIAMGDDSIDRRLVLSTDDVTGFSYAWEPFDTVERASGFELILRGLVPQPGPDVPIADVVLFRDRYRDELLRLRAALDGLVASIEQADSPIDRIRAARAEVELGVADVRAAARSGRLHLLGGVLTAFGLATTGVAVGDSAWGKVAFDGFGLAAFAAASHAVVRGGGRGNRYTYLVRAENEFGSSGH